MQIKTNVLTIETKTNKIEVKQLINGNYQVERKNGPKIINITLEEALKLVEAWQ